MSLQAPSINLVPTAGVDATPASSLITPLLVSSAPSWRAVAATWCWDLAVLLFPVKGKSWSRDFALTSDGVYGRHGAAPGSDHPDHGSTVPRSVAAVVTDGVRSGSPPMPAGRLPAEEAEPVARRDQRR